MPPENQEPITPQTPPEALQYPSTPTQPTQSAQVAIVDPGQTFGIISIVLAFLGFGIIGLVFPILGNNKAKAVGIKSTVSIVGIWINAIFLALSILLSGFLILLIILSAASK